jgi:glycosyltransferase involved in cell wall biosynthesis
MRIVIDLQGAQTDSRFRGIGRYAMNFTQAVIRNRGSHDIIIVLNGMFKETIRPIRDALEHVLPPDRVLVWEAPGPVAECEPENSHRRQAAELVREAFIASLRPDIVHLTSLFEGFVDDAVTSIGLHDAGFPVSVTIYDLIPLMNKAQFLQQSESYAAHYLRKIGHLHRAHTLLAISSSAMQEAVDHLRWPAERVFAVGAGGDDRFRKTDVSSARARELRTRFGLERPYFMYTSAPDVHKNHRRLIAAYALLPNAIRSVHQLAFVGRITPSAKAEFERYAEECGLSPQELVITGQVDDESLNQLFNLSKAFIFPSWHEGFGLPALEAMQCGKAVIGSRTSSIPEVIGRDDALFDPFNVQEIAGAIERLAVDDAWRADLEVHATSQAAVFNWDKVAKAAIRALEGAVLSANEVKHPVSVSNHRRPRLAFFSPLSPVRSGISHYSAELLPELMRYYDIELIIDQPTVDEAFVRANFPLRGIDWFRDHCDEFDRIVYQFGNSPFHEYMFAALEDHPGVVVLHDFYLSAVQESRHALVAAVQASHGYSAMHRGNARQDRAELVRNYPANLPVLQSALGLIVHSEHARCLGQRWYGTEAARDWAVIPLLRAPVVAGDTRAAARSALGLDPDDLLVCSFGFLDSTKLNHRTLAAWRNTPLAADPRAHLVFVGENHGGVYGETLHREIAQMPAGGRVRITGWSDASMFQQYLVAADIGVQLRSGSRGETSATVLDCMNHGLATIVNAHGALADLDSSGVWMLPDSFDDDALADALMRLAGDRDRRVALGRRGRSIIEREHAPRVCGAQFRAAIEAAYQRAEAGLHGLTRSLRRLHPTAAEGLSLATALARNFPPEPRRRQMLIDVSALVQIDRRSGIERVVRAVLGAWLDNPPEGWQVEPVYAAQAGEGYRYARHFVSGFLGLEDAWTEDDIAEAWPGDVFIGLDFQPYVIAAQEAILQHWNRRGVKIWFMLYDMLPMTMPRCFPEGASRLHEQWLRSISRFDGICCISSTVAQELSAWLRLEDLGQAHAPRVEWCQLGADLARSHPSTGLPDDAQAVLTRLAERPTFLMVGTIEPRKGHLQVLGAFEALWREGIDVNLAIVGAEGWKDLPVAERRTIPEIAARLRQHPEQRQRLFWLEAISDEYLERVYAVAICLIAASEGEGFGLPLVEAAQLGLPILARDIAVFREVAGAHAAYFKGAADIDLAAAIRAWLKRHETGSCPDSSEISWKTWPESAAAILKCIGITAI